MRLIIAIGTLCVAAVLLMVGFFFKFFSGPSEVALSVPVSTTSSYAVIDPSVLRINPGREVVSLAAPGMNTVAYGSETDIAAWLAGSSYVHVSTEANGSKPIVTEVSALESTAANPTAAAAADKTIVSPAGSDMWLGESTNPGGSTSLGMRLADDQRVIVATDGTKPLPSEIVVSWPKPKQLFLGMNDDVLIVVGGLILLVGILLYLWAVNHLRGGRGPRRRGRLPKAPKPNQRIGRGPRRSFGPTSGRRAIGKSAFVAVGVAGVMSLSLAGCSVEGGELPAPTPTPSSTANAEQVGPRPVVTAQQINLILNKVVNVMKTADEQNDATAIRTRLAGAALDARVARYAMRKSNDKITALPGITVNPVQLLLPQATDLWPRSVVAVVKADAASEEGKEPPTVAVVLTQASPRTNYQVVYITNLQAKQQIPEVASAQQGTPLVALDTTLLAVSPQNLAATYGDVLNKGEKSEANLLFDAESDQLRAVLANERKQQQGKEVKATFVDVSGAGAPVAFATVDGGALVAVQMNEVGTYTPLNNKDLKLSGQLTALAGVQIAAKPVQATYGFQLLFYVPPASAAQKIKLLGFVENLNGVTLK